MHLGTARILEDQTGHDAAWKLLAQMYRQLTGKALPEVCLFLLPICCLCITARTVMAKVKEWNELKGNMEGRCNQFLSDARYWPVAAFLLMWPLLGILIGFLILFGQKPDAIIKAWTDSPSTNTRGGIFLRGIK